MYAEMHDTPTHAKPRVKARESAHAYLRERALPRALGQVWPSAGGCKTASRKKFLSKRQVSRVRCARASTEPREFAIVLIIIVSGETVNRFAYVMNNPLSYTDPSGYFSLKKLFRAVFAIAVAWVTAGAIQPYMILNGYSVVAAKITAAAVGGFAGGLIASGGDLKAALQGAFTGGVFGGIGALTGGLSDIARIGAHAAGGCITSVASGGGCGSGALSGAFGKFTTLQTQEWGVGVAQFTASTIAGGIGSVLGGGKFENGAVTAAYGYLFNYCSQATVECWSLWCFRRANGRDLMRGWPWYGHVWWVTSGGRCRLDCEWGRDYTWL
jgi:hypothetical protein